MARIAENTVIVDGQEYKPGDVIPDFKSIKCVDTREPRKYQGLSADVSVLNDVIAKYASGGASCFMSDTGEYYEYDRKEKTWKLITNITERGFDSEKAYGALKHMLKNVTVSDEKIQSAVTNYLTVNPVLPGATTEQAWQIEQNKTDVAALKEETGSLKEDLTSKADKTALAQTDRKLDALWKLNQGISYKFEEDNTEAYQKTVPSGAKMVSIKSIGGKTIVWNQLIDETYGESVTRGNVTIVNNKDGSYTVFTNGAATETVTAGVYFLKANRDAGKYYLKGSPSNGKEIGYSLCGTYIWKPEYGKADYGNGVIIDDNVFLNNSDIVRIKVNEGTVISTPIVFKPQLFNLTKMFGSGNEPSTPEEFEAMFPTDYYPYNAGELMSAPVNEVVEQGRNLFDCYGFSCTNIPNIAAKRDIANGYGTTISTIDPTNRLIVTQNKADGSSKHDYRNGYFCIGIRGLKYNTNYILAFDFTPTKILIVDPIMKLLVNGKPDFGGSVSDFTLNVKKHVTIKFVYSANNDAQFLELRNSGMSGIIENFQIEEGTTVATYSPYHKTSYPIPQAIHSLDGYGESGNFVDFVEKKYHKGDMTIDISDIMGDTFQEPLEVEAGGTLTFKNSHGDDYRIPIPSSEEYVISLAEVAK